MSTVTSRDGTRIAFERLGDGPPLILVDGAMCHRGTGPAMPLAKLLAGTFTVYVYDRRGRGDSGDTPPYAVDREIEDLEALLAAAGGSAAVYGCSSGAVLAADAANRLPGITALALYEPPLIVDDTHEARPDTYLAEMDALIAADRRSDAVKKFLRSVGVPGPALVFMRLLPAWKKMTATAPTLPYDFRVLGDTGSGRPLPTNRWHAVAVPTLVMDGGKSPAYMRHAAQALSQRIAGAAYRTLPGQTHLLKPEAVAPVLVQFLGGAGAASTPPPSAASGTP
jgi:alpha-beta hydrolase superfamily lysophospholipase